MVQAVNNSIYGAQPRSLNINWMKYNVTDENSCPNSAASTTAQRSSPLRLKLQKKGEEILQRRQLITREQIEGRLSEAGLRRDHVSQEAQLRRTEPKMRRY